MGKQSELLIDSNENLILQTRLAVLIGDRPAIALQQIHFWLGINEKANKGEHLIDDSWWAYNTWQDWRKNNFPFWSLSTIRRVFAELETEGLIITRPHENKNKGAWVTINYGRLEEKLNAQAAPEKVRRRTRIPARSAQNEQTQKEARSAQNEQTGLLKMNRQSVQNEQDTGNTETTETKQRSKSVAAAINSKALDEFNATIGKGKVAGQIKPAQKPKRAKEYADVDPKVRTAIIEAWATNLPAMPVGAYSWDSNHSAAADIARAGYTADQVAGYVKHAMSDPFWRGKTLTLRKAGELMPAWVGKNKAKEALPPPTPLPPEVEGWGVDTFVRTPAGKAG